MMKRLRIKEARNKKIGIGAFIMIVLIGALYIAVNAAGEAPSLQAENGTLSGGAVAVSDTTASGGKYVRFQGATNPGGGNCDAKNPATGTTNWRLIFCDDFNGNSLDYTRWQTCNPSFPAGCVPHHDEAGNQEVSCFNAAQATDNPSANPHPGNKTNENVQVHSGGVHLRATKGGPKCPGNWRNDGYWTGMISTGPLKFGMKQDGYKPFTFTYGMYEARVKFPRGQAGYWPSLWMLPDQDKYGCWPKSGEFDVIEMHKNLAGWDKGSFNLHYGPDCNVNITKFVDYVQMPAADAGDYRIFALDWQPTGFRWYVNGKLVHTNNDPNARRGHPFYIIANFSLSNKWTGGNYKNSTYPAETVIDWVRVWQH